MPEPHARLQNLLAAHDLVPSIPNSLRDGYYVNQQDGTRRFVLWMRHLPNHGTLDTRFNSYDKTRGKDPVFPKTLLPERPDMTREDWLAWLEQLIQARVDEIGETTRLVVTTGRYDAPLFARHGYTQDNGIIQMSKTFTPTP